MRSIFLSLFALSSQLFSEPIEFEKNLNEPPPTEALLEKRRQPPRNLEKRSLEGKIVENKSSIEWQGKLGNVNVKIVADHVDFQSQCQAEWERQRSNSMPSQKSNKGKNNNGSKDPFKEDKNWSPSVHFSLSWSSDD